MYRSNFVVPNGEDAAHLVCVASCDAQMIPHSKELWTQNMCAVEAGGLPLNLEVLEQKPVIWNVLVNLKED